MLFERDSCSSYGWQQFYVNFGDWKIKSDGQLEFNLTGLTQFTNYAYTVQTYQYGETSLYQNNDNEGAISAVKIFRTDLLAPSRVKNLKVIKKTPSSIQLQWEVLENEVDAIKHFLVDIITKPFSTAAIDQRNFCANPIDISEYQLIEVYDEEETVDVTKDLTCCEQCCKFDKDRKEIRKKTNNDFEEALINFSDEVSRNSWEPSFKIKMLPDFLDRLEIEPQRRNYTIKELNSTTPYLFYVHACSNSLKCSTYSLVSETTDRNSSDTYDKVHIKPMSLVFEIDHFHVYFDEPKVKNGVILNYITEISQIVDNITQFFFSDCITRKQHEKNRFK